MSDILFELLPDGIAVLTFNRPQARNALTVAAMRQFSAQIATVADIIQQSPERLRALILTGAGDAAFCAGGDLIDLSQRPTEAEGLAFITVMGDALAQMERLPIPVIAAVNGYALGGGSEIATACDMRIIDAATQMGFVQIRMAITPGWGAGQRLLRLVGYSRALAILLEGRPMRAEELLQLGLAHEIAPRGEALDAALVFARKTLAYPHEAVAAVKQLLWAGLTENYADALAAERALFPPLWAAPPHLDAVNAFLNRRA